MLQERAVLSLIDEEAGLLSAKPIDMEAKPVLRGQVLVGGAAQDKLVLLAKVGLEGQGGLALVIDMLQAVAHHFLQRLGNGHAADVHTDAVGLHDGCLAIAVDDQSGEVVALAVYEAVGRVDALAEMFATEGSLLRAIDADGLAHLPGRGEAALPEVVVDGHIVEREDADGNGSHLDVAHAEETAVEAYHAHHVALFEPVVHAGNGTTKHPRMETAQRLLLAFLQIYRLIHADLLRLFLQVHNRPSAEARSTSHRG